MKHAKAIFHIATARGRIGLACAARETSLDGRETGSDTTTSSSGAGETDASDTTDTTEPDLSCSVLAQDCPAGQKCTYSSYETPLTTCVEVTNFGLSGQAGQPCTWHGNGVDTCDATSMCWGWHEEEPEPQGTCVLFCTDTPEGPRCADAKACGPEEFLLCAYDCDAFVQNCPAGQKCVPYSSDGGPNFTYNDYKCVDIGGDQQPGEPCISDGVATMNDDCALGGFCADVVADGDVFLGQCFGQCTGTADEAICPPGQVCDLWGQGGPFVCETTCDPLANDCEPGKSCDWWPNGYFKCLDTADIPIGEPCTDIGQCTAGALCVDASFLPECSESGCCSPYCNLLEPDCSEAPGTECAPYFEPGMAPAGLEHIGGCAVVP